MKKLSRLVALVAIVAVAATTSVVLLTDNGSTTPQAATGSVHPSGWGATPKGLRLLGPAPTATVPTATMYDAVSIGQIPAGPYAVAGYTAGNWPTWAPLLAAFPRSHHVSIAIRASNHAMCLDDEPGDATPAQAGPWVLADIKAGFPKPCVYGDLSDMPAIQASIRAALGSNWRGRVLLWLAWFRGFPGLVGSYDAVQYTDHCLGRNLDCSTVTLDFLRIAQPPYVAPKPRPAPQPLPVCFSHRIPAKSCAAVKAKVASQQRAATSSARALTVTNRILATNRCVRPYRRGVCIHKGHDARVFGQRVRWFTARAAALRAAN